MAGSQNCCETLFSFFWQIFDRSKQLSSSDKSKLDAAVHDASIQLSQFCLENPHTGPPSLACFIIIALCPLSRRWLFMEHTAQGKAKGHPWVQSSKGHPWVQSSQGLVMKRLRFL